MRAVTVVGAGITGLAAAHELRTATEADFAILESDARVGGRVLGGQVGPLDVDAGADGFLARQPEMADLCRELGLGPDLVSPRTSSAYIWARGALRPIPSPSVLGVPLDPESLADSGILSTAGVQEFEARSKREHPPLTEDASIGEVIRARLGDEVFEYLVDPLLGGINAGNSDHISIDAGAPALAEGARAGGRLIESLRPRSEARGPIFLGVRGGSQRIVDTLEESLGESVELGCGVESLTRAEDGWRIATNRGEHSSRAVVLATPAPVTAALVEPHAPAAATALRSVELADVVLVTFVYPLDAIDRPLDASGFLVPRAEGLLMTACSWSSAKWAHYDDGSHAILRVSAGRTDDARWLELDDDALVEQLCADLATTMGITAPPLASRLSPWRRSLPQYRPGHLSRVDEVDRLLEESMPGVVATGAAFRGLGLPACVRQGRGAARRAIRHLQR